VRSLTPSARKPLAGKGRLLLFGSGDFACNLYWQAVTLYLLFFYTDVLGLSPALAGFIYMAGAVWDGIADLLVGIAADRSRQAYRRFVAWGAVPLGLSFPLLFVLPGVEGWPLVALVLGAQMVFRSFYALVNVPYAAWSARISEDSRDRTLVAGARLGFGAAAAMLVALSMSKPGPNPVPGGGFVVTAAIFAMAATPLLIVVARASPEHSVQERQVERVSIAASLGALGRNRAFVTLNIAMIAATIAAAVLNQSVLYYFTHVAGRAEGGAAALAAMALAGAGAVPVWTAVALRVGARAAWLAGVAFGSVALGLFAALGVPMALAFLVAMQVVFTGLGLAGWAMLPNTIDYGEFRQGVRAEATAFGLSALLQKVALGLAAMGLGSYYSALGYDGGATQGIAARDGIAWLMLAVPVVALGISALAMLANPLKRGTHGAIIAKLAMRRGRAVDAAALERPT
jgi:GPH family glycoside/pentoside/hexuronide:cation symporter